MSEGQANIHAYPPGTTFHDLIRKNKRNSVLLVLLMMLLASHGRTDRRMQSNTQLRGIHQAMVMYAQSNGGYFPGLDASGAPAALDVEQRFKTLLDDNLRRPEYLISPSETASHIHDWHAGPFTSDHYSYAMLQVPVAGGRHGEWHETLNPNAIVMADRNTGTAAAPASIYTGRQRPASTGCAWMAGTYQNWAGGIVFNDNAVQFTESHRHPTEYAGHADVDDHLFEAAGDDDAYMVHSGN